MELRLVQLISNGQTDSLGGYMIEVAQNADSGNTIEALAKIATAALPVVGAIIGVVITIRRLPARLRESDRIRPLVLPNNAIRGPLLYMPKAMLLFQKLGRSPLFVSCFGFLYILLGIAFDAPFIWIPGGAYTAFGIGWAYWRLLMSYPRTKNDVVETTIRVEGQLSDAMNSIEQALRRIRAQVDVFDRTQGRIQASIPRKKTTVNIAFSRVDVKRRSYWISRVTDDQERHDLRIQIQSDSPSIPTVNRNLKYAQRLVQEMTGIRLRRPEAYKEEGAE